MCPHTTHLNWYYLDQCIPATKSFSGQFNNNLSYLRLVCVLFTIENSRRCMTSELEQHLSRSDCIHTPLQCNDPNKKRTLNNTMKIRLFKLEVIQRKLRTPPAIKDNQTSFLTSFGFWFLCLYLCFFKIALLVLIDLREQYK